MSRPGPGPAPRSGSGPTPQSGPESTPRPGHGPTPRSAPGPTSQPGPGSAPRSGPGPTPLGAPRSGAGPTPTAAPGPAPSAAADPALTGYTERLFGHLSRADQRRWAHVYLQGLLTAPGKKSVRELAASVTDSPTAYQSLQQFINASPWEWEPARRELLRWVGERHAPAAWTVGQAVLPKRGSHSVGVHRRFDPAAGRTLNCQLGIGIFAGLDESTGIPVDWRLLLPEPWLADADRRRRARIDPDTSYRSPASLILDLADSVRDAPRAPLVADLSRTARAGELVAALAARGWDLLVAVPPTLTLTPAGLPTGTELTAAGVAALGRLRHPQAMRVHSTLVRLPDLPQPCRLFTQRRNGPFWLTTLTRHRMDDLLHLTLLQGAPAATTRRLADAYGLLDFEGRSYPGWHHHMTLVSAAYAYDAAPAAPHRHRLPGAA
ncbi:transposase [Streptomyces sp. NPDC007945]|uniref:IS701 family transposase n=1 Tax=Streptomyces sp. NPDC007945 TaxID=3364797 RepID=UPI0036E5EF7B